MHEKGRSDNSRYGREQGQSPLDLIINLRQVFRRYTICEDSNRRREQIAIQSHED